MVILKIVIIFNLIISDALDNLNNKQALQRADKILKKEKDFHCAKVLKSLALVRLKRGPEAVAILDEVKQFLPLDECTLQAMTVCYKELLQRKKSYKSHMQPAGHKSHTQPPAHKSHTQSAAHTQNR